MEIEIKYISDKEKEVVELLSRLDQRHIIEQIPKFSEKEREDFIQQIDKLNTTYPGGLESYYSRAKVLLKEAAENQNPYEGFQPNVPKGLSVDFYSPDIHELEQLGVNVLKDTAFVLVAGGLGERLGYNGIKVEIPIDTLTQTTFLQYYINYILAFQQKSGGSRPLPLAIMTSDDTYTQTVKLLESNNNFGIDKDQLFIMKQEKVPAMIDNDAHFALRSGALEIETKPHGHGDVHTLLFLHKYVQKLNEQGFKYIVFFQDTNPLVFRSLPAILGVSQKHNLELNSLAIPRKVGEAVGAICNLQRQDGSSITINVEYNQLDGLLKDYGGEKLDEKGFSVYPGNVNGLVFSIPEYNQVLNETQGLIAEFINPKYADATKTKFKSATRLECMMQDYPKLLKSSERVGFTQIDRRFCFSACKNDLGSCAIKFSQNLPPEGAQSCEYDLYWLNAEILRISGAHIEYPPESEKKSYAGIELNFAQKIFLDPKFGITLQEIKSKLNNVKISGKSNVIIAEDMKLENVVIDGSVRISTNLQNIELTNQKSVDIQPLTESDKDIPDWLKIRGYCAINRDNIENIH